MDRYTTVMRGEPEFIPLIQGTFAEDQRAIPVNSYSVMSNRERVTFRIVPVSELERPPLWKIAWSAIRPIYLSLGLGPLLSILVFLTLHGAGLETWDLLCTSFSLLCLHVAVFLLNDYYDYVRGVDRRNPNRGSRILQNGWLAGYQMRRAGYAFLLLGILLAIPVLALHPLSLTFVAGLGALAILSHGLLGGQLIWPWMAEALRFMSLGPLLAYGYMLALTGEVEPFVVLTGVIFGLLAALLFQLKNLQNLLHEKIDPRGDLISRLGFDRSRRLIVWELRALRFFSLLLILWPEYGLFLIPATALLWFGARYVSQSLQAAASPLSSTLLDLWIAPARMHALFSITLILAMLAPWLLNPFLS